MSASLNHETAIYYFFYGVIKKIILPLSLSLHPSPNTLTNTETHFSYLIFSYVHGMKGGKCFDCYCEVERVRDREGVRSKGKVHDLDF